MDGFAERIAHVDMDAFFVEVERLRRPALVGRAVVVGGAGPRGVVASASYEARARGVTSAMPMARALRMCPHAVVVPPDHTAYREASRSVFAVLESLTPQVEALSVDEAFLDIGGLRLHYPDPQAVGEQIRRRVQGETELPCSVGIGTTKMIAKMASRDAKPAGLRVVAVAEQVAYLYAKPVRALWGVGEATHARLEELGVRTVGDLATFPEVTLKARLGEALGGMLADLASGRDPRSAGSRPAGHTISVEETYDVDITSTDRLEGELLAHADRLVARLREAGYLATTVHLKVRFDDFTTVTRSLTFPQPMATAPQVYRAARRLLGRTAAGTKPVRLLGLAADGLIEAAAPRQLDLESGDWDTAESTISDIRRRFGRDAVGRARLLEPDEE